MKQINEFVVKATGKKVKLYKLKNGNWCDAEDCTTEYNENDIVKIERLNK